MLPRKRQGAVRDRDHRVNPAPGVLCSQVLRGQAGLQCRWKVERVETLDVDVDRPGARASQRVLDCVIECRAKRCFLALIVEHDKMPDRLRLPVRRTGREDGHRQRKQGSLNDVRHCQKSTFAPSWICLEDPMSPAGYLVLVIRPNAGLPTTFPGWPKFA